MEKRRRTRDRKANARGTIEVGDTQSDAAAHGVADAAALFIETRTKSDTRRSVYRPGGISRRLFKIQTKIRGEGCGTKREFGFRLFRNE